MRSEKVPRVSANYCKHTALYLQSMKDQVADLGAFIRSQRERSAISLRNLADRAGISNPYLSQIERGLRKPSADILKAIARGLSISAETLYVQAGWLDEDVESGSVTEAIQLDAKLTDPQRRALLQVYQSFLDQNQDPNRETTEKSKE